MGDMNFVTLFRIGEYEVFYIPKSENDKINSVLLQGVAGGKKTAEDIFFYSNMCLILTY